MLKTGYVGDIWGAQVRISKKQTAGTVNVLADPQFLGVISVRVDLSVMDELERPCKTSLYAGSLSRRKRATMVIRREVRRKRRPPQRLATEQHNGSMVYQT